MRMCLIAMIVSLSACDNTFNVQTIADPAVSSEAASALAQPAQTTTGSPGNVPFELQVVEIEPDLERDRLFVTYRNDSESSVSDARLACRLLDMTDEVFAKGKAPAAPTERKSIAIASLVRLTGDLDRVDIRTRLTVPG